MEKQIKVVVAHPDRQHSFMTAVALQEKGILAKYITTVYDKKGSLTNFFIKLVRGPWRVRLQNHKCALLKDENVLQYNEFLSLLLFLVFRMDKSKKLFTALENFRNDRFNVKVAKFCIKHNVDVLISFDTVSYKALKMLSDRKIAVQKVIDMSAPYRPYMHDVFTGALDGTDMTKDLTETMRKYRYTSFVENAKKELPYADAFLVASDFTAKSLTSYGVDASRIHQCIYGMDSSFFSADGRKERASGPLSCVFVGNVNSQKGVHYFLNAADRFSKEELQITLMGAYDDSSLLYKKYCKRCTFTGHILKTDLRDNLWEADIMVFPSLADGFGFSVLEAMACGVVPICSRNAGVSCIVEDGVNGFVVDAMNTEQIYEKLFFVLNNREQLPAMRQKAIETAKSLTWDSYFEDVIRAVENIADGRKSL